MKTLYKSLIAAAVLTPTLTGCIEEVFPTNGATTEQVQQNPNATEAIASAMPAYMNHYATISNSYHFDWGYGSLMRIRDVMTSDMSVPGPYGYEGYDWYSNFAQGVYLGESYVYGQFVWNLYTQLVLTANTMIDAVNPDHATAQQLVYLGQGYAYRASHYLDMARMYEFLQNDAVSSINKDGNNVLGLTVPIVTNETTEEDARHNPRATHQEMFNFILGDLQQAEKYLTGVSVSDKTMPSLAVVYGLYARLYMWDESYPQAAEYAAKAISAAGGPGAITTAAQWHDIATGFNTLSTPSWMWGVQCVMEDAVVQSGILNWASWMSNENNQGYAQAGALLNIASAIYDRISDTDFRKLSYLAPVDSPLSGMEPINETSELYYWYYPEELEYVSLKFRPGQGNCDDYTIAAATAYPLMRIEEMYLIQAEAVAHSNAAEGKSLLEAFMAFRDPEYTCTATSQAEIVEEIVFQKRVELWGEGQTYFDLKRLGMPVVRFYEGTNFIGDYVFNTGTMEAFMAGNTGGRSAYMNFCIVQTEQNNNEDLMGWNNPDPSAAYPVLGDF